MINKEEIESIVANIIEEGGVVLCQLVGQTNIYILVKCKDEYSIHSYKILKVEHTCSTISAENAAYLYLSWISLGGSWALSYISLENIDKDFRNIVAAALL